MHKILTSYPLSVLSVAVIWVLCLIPIPETPLNDVSMIDKWTHFVLYGGLCTIVWAEYGRQHTRPLNKQVWIYTLLLPVIMGGLIEIVQATCTGGNRSGDIMGLGCRQHRRGAWAAYRYSSGTNSFQVEKGWASMWEL